MDTKRDKIQIQGNLYRLNNNNNNCNKNSSNTYQSHPIEVRKVTVNTIRNVRTGTIIAGKK
jgi:hypothetical protein